MGLWLRAWVALRFDVPCLRDECTYRLLARRMIDGDGMTVPSEVRRWIWAPGYPALLSGHEWLGDMDWIRWTQVALTLPLVWAGASIARRLGGRDAGIIAAWCLALSPTLIFFSTRYWSETVYITLLLGAFATLEWSRGSVARSVLPGVLLAGTVLLRGIAAPMLVLFAAARWSMDRDVKAAAALLLSGALCIAPYSLYASKTFGGPVLTDRTMGQMMWLGNNDFPPVSFDHGVGPLAPEQWERVLATGREHCDGALDPVAWDRCETAAARDWIAANPREFVRRVPLRWAQLMNPNSFLTRDIRSRAWRGLPAWGGEALGVTTVLWSLIAVVGGLIGLTSHGKGRFAALTVVMVAYHFAAITLVAGLSRYRVPLDVLGLLWASVWMGNLPGTLGRLRGWRGVALVALVAPALVLMGWLVLPGFLP